jgi:restriction endonuclease S subunit
MTLQIVPFEALGQISQGIPIKRYKSSQGVSYPIVNVGDLNHLLIEEVSYHVNLEIHNAQRYEVIEDDVVIATRGTLLKSSVVTKAVKKSLSNQTTVFFRPDKTLVNPLYIAVLLRSDYFEELLALEQQRSTTTLASMRVSELRQLRIPLPEIHIQHQIGQLFLSMERLEKVTLATIEARRSLSKSALFQAIEK